MAKAEARLVMSKLRVSTREIGSVRVFDLQGDPTQEGLQEVATKIQKNIRRYRVQRVILNLQLVPEIGPLGVRKLLAACIRPQRSLIFRASKPVEDVLDDSYLPQNVRVCQSEKEIAEDFGPFLMEKETNKKFDSEKTLEEGKPSLGKEVEQRRSKRMHVALPVQIKLFLGQDEVLTSPAIATNISEGGLFAEYLDLAVAERVGEIDPIYGLKAEITIFPSANFPEEYKLTGIIKRKECRKKQLGIAIEFLPQA